MCRGWAIFIFLVFADAGYAGQKEADECFNTCIKNKGQSVYGRSDGRNFAVTGVDMKWCLIDCSKKHLHMTVVIPDPSVIGHIPTNNQDNNQQNGGSNQNSNPPPVDIPEENFYAPAIDLPEKWYEQCEYGEDYATGGENAQVLENITSDSGTIKCGIAEVDYRCSSFGEVAEHLTENPPADNGVNCWCRLRAGDKIKKWVYNYTYQIYDDGRNGCSKGAASLFEGGACRQHCASLVKAGDTFWLKRLNYNNLSSLTILPHGTPSNWNKTCYNPNDSQDWESWFGPCGNYADKQSLCLLKDETPEQYGKPTDESSQCWFRLTKGDKEGFWVKGSLYTKDESHPNLSARSWCVTSCPFSFSKWLYNRRGQMEFISNGQPYLIITSRNDL